MNFTTLSLAAFTYTSLSTTGFAAVNIDWVHVGHAGNDPDLATPRLSGAVTYVYNIGKYEVTNAQYTEFLNAVDPVGANANGIWNSEMGSDARSGISFNAGAANGSKYTIRTNMGNKPVNYVSWYDAARFANWQHNGQGSGSTETGAYTLSGNTGIILRNVGATVWLPSEDEWYKAAFYDPTRSEIPGQQYWTYATQSNTAPTVATANVIGDISNPGANVANFNLGADWNGQNGNVTTVGSAAANNYFGTADMSGNVWEWTDEVISGVSRARSGGAWGNTSASSLSSMAAGTFEDPTIESRSVGFRVAGIPEPSSFLLTMLAGGAMLIRRKR